MSISPDRAAETPDGIAAAFLRTVPGSLASRGMVCRDPPEHDADHGEADEGGSFASVTFEVLGESTAVADPGEGPFDDPALGQDNKAVQIGALDDVQPPRTGLGDHLGHFRRLVATISVDALNEVEGAASLSQPDSGTV